MMEDRQSSMGMQPSVAANRSVHISEFWARLPRPLAGLPVAATAAIVTAAATLFGLALVRWLPHQSVALVYLLSVMLAALVFGMTTGLTVAFLSFLTYNFFFIHPIYTFTIADPQELFALFAFLVVAVLTGSLAGRMRQAADAAQRRASALQALNDFAATLSGSRDLASILSGLANQTGATIRGHAVVMLEHQEDMQIQASTPDAPTLEPVEWQAAQRTLRSAETIYAAAPGWPGSRYEFQPLKSAKGAFGVVGLAPFDGQRSISFHDDATLQTIFRHACIAIERTRLEAEAAMARDEIERERLRSALLSSLSHDLRTPLASILGAVTSLRELGAGMTAETRADLLVAIEEETERLSRFVSNLLDMTRLEANAIDLKRDWVDLGEVAQLAVGRARRLFQNSQITLALAPNLPAILGDTTLVEHVVLNLIDNGVKFSEPGAMVAVGISVDEHNLILTVTDKGCGIPPDALAHVFETFYRVRESNVPGTGLGLAICKRIVEGMGGSINAESPVAKRQGTRIIARFPVPRSGVGLAGDDKGQLS